MIGDLGGSLICAKAQINSQGVASKYLKLVLDICSAPTASEPCGFASHQNCQNKK